MRRLHGVNWHTGIEPQQGIKPFHFLLQVEMKETENNVPVVAGVSAFGIFYLLEAAVIVSSTRIPTLQEGALWMNDLVTKWRADVHAVHSRHLTLPL